MIIYSSFLYLQHHNGFFGDTHDVITMTDYDASPGKYKLVVCKQHKRKLEWACTNCMESVCDFCKIEDEECAGNLSILRLYNMKVYKCVDII